VEEDEDVPYIKMNVSDKITAYRTQGYLSSQIVFFLMNLHLQPRTIWLTRHGQSEYNLEDKIGGNPHLTQRGLTYAKRLAEWFQKSEFPRFTAECEQRRLHEIGKNNTNHSSLNDASSHQNSAAHSSPPSPQKIEIWTSTLKRTIETVQFFEAAHQELPALNEINAGICEGMTYDEIKVSMPDVHAARNADKLGYRYPQGESYLDVIQRLKPLICELERQRESIVVIAHQAIIRTILGYFISSPIDQLPYLEIPLDTVFRLTPTLYGCEQVQIPLKNDLQL